jgi:hypothetical protein
VAIIKNCKDIEPYFAPFVDGLLSVLCLHGPGHGPHHTTTLLIGGTRERGHGATGEQVDK